MTKRLEIKNYNMTLTKKQPKKSGGKIDKYDLLTGEETLPFSQIRIIKQATFT